MNIDTPKEPVKNFTSITTKIEEDIIYLTLNRPKVNNALNEQLILEFTEVLKSIEEQNNLRALILKANGSNFCAGADLKWMKEIIDSPKIDHIKDSNKLTKLLEAIYNLPIPTICIITGATYGGGIGILAACDMVIADANCSFCFSEAKLGLIPAVISPYIVEAIGLRQTKRLFLTGEKFDAKQAYHYGLVQRICNSDELHKIESETVQNILACAPLAIKHIKKLFHQENLEQKNPKLMDTLTELIAKIRISEEAQHGMHSFLSKKKPRWHK